MKEIFQSCTNITSGYEHHSFSQYILNYSNTFIDIIKNSQFNRYEKHKYVCDQNH